MKELIRSGILASILVFGLSGVSFAQLSDNANVTGELTIVQALTADFTGTVDFGGIEAADVSGSGATLALDSDGNVTGLTSNGATSAGGLEIGATPGTEVSFTFGPATSGDVTFTPVIYDASDNTYDSGSTLAISSTTTNLDVGGEMSISSGAAPQIYSITSTVTVAYSSY